MSCKMLKIGILVPYSEKFPASHTLVAFNIFKCDKMFPAVQVFLVTCQNVQKSINYSRDVMLMLDFTLENVSALPTVEYSGPPLEMKLAVVRLVGRLALQHHVTEVTVMRII